MDLNIVLWIGGMLFSLGVFAVKVGLGLGCGNFTINVVALTLTSYTALFMLIAVAAERLMRLATPFLQKGPWMHTFLATGLIVWGLVVIFKETGRPVQTGTSRGASLLMVIPCPICLSAMTFSTWAAFTIIKQPPLLVGLSLGVSFSVMALLVTIAFKARTGNRSQTSLGIAMVVLGLYFVLSLFLPAKIEAARSMYQSFDNDSLMPVSHDTAGVLVFLIVLLFAGFFAGKSFRSLQ
jgi:predicted transporter